MTHQIDLPSGGTAEMKDSNEVTRGEKKAAENARVRMGASTAQSPLSKMNEADDATYAAVVALSDEEMQPWEGYQNLLAKICLVSWSFGKLPVEPDDFDVMGDEDYEAIVNDAYQVIFRKPLEFGPDGQADPKAPTASSNGSAPTSTETDDSSEKTTQTQP